MKKSKYVFAIMAVVYLVVAISERFGWLTITENILLGLSLSALLSAVSDILYNIGYLFIATNEFNYIIRITSEFLEDRLSKNYSISNSNINIRNVKACVEGMDKNYKTAVHPNEFYKKKRIKVVYVLSQVSFIISIGVFIFVPFLPALPQQSLSTFLTLIAFSAMSFNLHMSEAVSDKTAARNDFMNKEQVIIQTAYPDFSNALNAQLYYREDIVATGAKDGDLNADT